MEIRITSNYSERDIPPITDYLRAQSSVLKKTDYPDIIDWTLKVEEQLRNRIKRAVVAYSGVEVVGVSVFQRRVPAFLEIKHLSVKSNYRGRHLATMLLRNSEIEGWEWTAATDVICDAKKTNLPVMHFLLRQGYRIVGDSDLYHLGTGDDLTYLKSLSYLRLR